MKISDLLPKNAKLGSGQQRGQYILFSVVSTPSPPHPPRQCLGPTGHLYSNTVSRVRACLSIWLEKFRGNKKKDDRGLFSIQSSLGQGLRTYNMTVLLEIRVVKVNVLNINVIK